MVRIVTEDAKQSADIKELTIVGGGTTQTESDGKVSVTVPGSASTGTQNLAAVLALGDNAGGSKITGLAPGVVSSDAATVGQLPATPTLATILAASTNAGANKISNLAPGTFSTDAATVGQIPTGSLPSGAITGTYLAGNTGAAPTWENILYQQLENVPTDLTVTPVKSANYSLLPADFAVFDCSANSCTGTLPLKPPDGTEVAVKIINWAAGYTLSLATQSPDVFNISGGSTTLILRYNLMSLVVVYHQVAGIWYVKSQDIGAALTTVLQNTQAGPTYTLAIGDAGAVVEMNNASANTLTVPPNSSVAFPVGTVVEVFQYGAGLTTVAAGAGVTIDSPGAVLTLGGQYATAALRKRGTNEWVLSGNL